MNERQTTTSVIASATMDSAGAACADAQATLKPCIDLVILANTQTPYRLHFHRRIAREMPDVRLWSLFTHEHDKQRWDWVEDETIRTRCFGWNESIAEPATLKRRLRDWRKGGRVIDWLERHHVNALLVLGYADIGKVRVLRWARRNGVPTMMFLDSNVFGDRARGWRRIAKRLVVPRVFARCDCFLPCGSAGKAYLQRYGVSADQISYSPVEPDYAIYATLSQARIAEAQTRFGLAPERRRLVYCGRLASEKRVDLLLDAFLRIARDRPNWNLVLIGDGPLRERLRQTALALEPHRIIWTGFIAEPSAVAAVYKNCDALVLPSDYEPWGLVVNEAAAAGLAIVASDVVGAARELVRPGVNGAYFRPGDVDALADALRTVTAPEMIDNLKAGSAVVLADWRRKADPITGLRQAMERIGASPVECATERS